MDHRLPGGVPAVRVASRLHLATFFTAPSPPSPSRRGRTGGPPPALTADVRIVIRQHFPAVVGPGGARTVKVEKVAEESALRRRLSRALRTTESVGRALAGDVLPLVRHRFDRGAVVAAGREICAHVAAACADPRVAHVLVLINTFACPVLLRRPPPIINRPVQRSVVCAPPKSFVLAKTAGPCVDIESTVLPAEKLKPVGVIGDKRPKPAVEERFKGWVPW